MQNEIKLAESLSKQLLLQRLSLSSVARKVKVNKSTLHGWANGVTPQPLVALVALAEYFEISLDQLCLGKAPPPKNPKELNFSVKLQIHEPNHDCVLITTKNN